MVNRFVKSQTLATLCLINKLVETFINILPYENVNAKMSITNDDLSAYGLLEAVENKKTAQICDFVRQSSQSSSDIVVGSPKVFCCLSTTLL